ncbi:MAG TPA: hypothetical protein VGF85_10910 [Opitutaceae bacterium]|jgi:hypothetical protein
MSRVRCLLLAIALAVGPPGRAAETAGSATDEAARWLDLCLKEQGVVAIGTAPSVTRTAIEQEPGVGRVNFRGVLMQDGRFYVSIATPSLGTLIRAFDGHVAWQRNGTLGSGFIAPSMRDSIRADITPVVGAGTLKRFPKRRVLDYRDEAGVPCVRLELASESGAKQIWTLGRDDARVLKIEHAATPFGRDCTITYSDYRPVGEGKLPFLVAVRGSQGTYSEQRSTIELGGPVDPSLFAPPAGLLPEAEFVTALIHRHLAHEGDLGALAATTSKVVHERQENPVAGTSEEITLYVARGAPNRFLEVRKTKGMGTSAIGFDGRDGWASSETEGNRSLDRDEIVSYLANVTLKGDIDMAERYPLRRYLGERLVDGRKTYAVLLSGLYQRAAVFHFDPETYRVVRIGAAKLGTSSNNVEATLDFADFRRVSGIEFPFRVTTSNAAFHTVTVVDSIDLNVDIPRDTFARKDYAPMN